MIDIPVSFGELVDKLTILELKGHYIKDNNKSINIKYELQLLKKLYKEYYNTGDLPIKNHIHDLKSKGIDNPSTPESELLKELTFKILH